MKLRAARLEWLPEEQVEVVRPGDLERQYEKVARGVGLALLFPGTLGTLVMLFTMPAQLGVVPVILACSFLHALLLLGLLALVSLLQGPLVQALLRFGWPVHRWWMVRQHPDQVQLEAHRRAVPRTSPLPLELRAAEGVLVAGERALDLHALRDLGLEWGAEPGPRLRLCLLVAGEPLVLCSPLPWSLYWRWRPGIEALPRLEAGGVQLEWVEFQRLLQGLKPFCEAAGLRWPPLLERALVER
jgi:hypothetical protein